MKAKLQQLGVWCQQLLYKGHGQLGVDLVYNLKGNTTFIKKSSHNVKVRLANCSDRHRKL